MTSVGFAILDYFTLSLDTKYARGKWLMTDRDIAFLKEMFCWEELSFATDKEIALQTNMSSERVRQIKHKALKRLRIAAKQGKNPAKNIITIIERSIKKDKDRNPHQAIINLCINEMPELPPYQIIKLLAELYFNKHSEIQATYNRYVFLNKTAEQKADYEIRKDQRRQETEAGLKTQLNKDIIWFDRIEKWSKESFVGLQPKRKVNQSEKYHFGEFFSIKCNRAVQYESGAELSFIKKLEANPAVIYYLELLVMR
ncbi:sigma-70-like protein [Mucilaginibacter gracilis]|uniref:Sigma-70-like protein n=1 Tax=Mucilaginibacter gracilis TaxID=423350 RepID=A0A495IVK0_9SPHI|nr:sigma factor-like helix-turn-helix DNA-binding protein [Mucilaginibacter gracilis]RKR80750.1 sigma-70-like protein [Mucilaginibacter gracilis]